MQVHVLTFFSSESHWVYNWFSAESMLILSITDSHDTPAYMQTIPSTRGTEKQGIEDACASQEGLP